MTEKRNFATVLYKYMVMSLTIIYILHSVNASSVMGNITIYIKDQDGKNVYANSHLVGNLTVEIYYNGELYIERIFNEQNLDKEDGKPTDHMTIPVNHTGLYTVRAVATLEFNDSESCYTGERDYYVPPDTLKCEMSAGEIFYRD